MKSILKLFNALYVEDPKKLRESKAVDQATLPYGFLFSPEVKGNYLDRQLYSFLNDVTETIGLTKEEMNNTFHKKWEKVRNTPIDQLIVEQITHYFTTYGYEALGVYSKDTVYIPAEKLDIPDKKQIKIVIIRGFNRPELITKCLTVIDSGIALKQETIEVILDIFTLLKYDPIIETLKNKEMRCILYKKTEKLPQDEIEFIRYLCYLATEKTLLIKDKNTIQLIKNKCLDSYLEAYCKIYDTRNMASIFYRFKPIFLALKANASQENKHLINRIRKLATTYHLPMKQDYLNTLTTNLKSLDIGILCKELAKAKIFRKIRLLYALNFRLQGCNSILYRIRNGKSYATKFLPNNTNCQIAIDEIKASIVNDLAVKVKGKRICIDKMVTYALPATEKMFTQNIPTGTFLTLPTNMVVGVSWNNVENYRVDLDLALVGLEKIGWDTQYRNSNRTVLFSGDITDASNGATEAYYLEKQTESDYLLTLNYFTFNPEAPVPFKFFAAQQKGIFATHKNYVVDPSLVQFVLPSKIDVKQRVLGLVQTTKHDTRFYFGEFTMGNNITSRRKDYTDQTREYMLASAKNTISLNELLEKAGAIITQNKEKCDIDLSIENLQKDTILSLL